MADIFNLRMDPYERAQITSNTFYDWMFRHIFLLVPAQAIVAEFLATFKEFPPRQKSASFSLDQVIEKMTEASSSGGHRASRTASVNRRGGKMGRAMWWRGAVELWRRRHLDFRFSRAEADIP